MQTNKNNKHTKQITNPELHNMRSLL